jgi:hypothetical protein
VSDLGTNKDDLSLVAGLKVADDQDAKLNRETFMQYRASRQKWYSDKVENERFYHNVQYSDDEEKEIKAKGQSPITINITHAIVKQIISFLTSNSPTWYVDPVGDSDKEKTYLFRKLLDATWYNSRGRRQFSQICKEVGICGVGYGMVTPNTSNPFGIKFSRQPYHNVYIDPYSSEFDYSDADNIIISKLQSKNQASLFLGLTIDEIEEYAASDETMAMPSDDPMVTNYPRYILPTGNMKSRVRIIQRQTMEMTDVYIVTPIDNKVPLTRKMYFNLDDRLKSLEAKKFVKIEKKPMRVMAKYISLGKYCEKYYLPLDGYNITPFIDEYAGNPYPLGALDFLYGLQRALNKFILLTLLNASLSNNMKMMAVKNSINKKQYEDSYAVPGSLIEWEPNPDMPNGGAPQQISPVPLSNEFFAFPQMIISMMEYITGIFGVMQGDPEGAPRTASGLMSLQNFGGQKVKLLGRSMEDALCAVGNNTIALFQNYAGLNQTISYFNEQENKNEQLKFNTLNIYDGGKFKIENDLSAGKYSARVEIRQDYGSERQGKAQILGNIMAQTKSMALLKPILKLADIPEADQILKEVDEIAKLTQQSQGLQQNLQRMQQVNDQLQNQILQKSQKVELTQFVASLEILKTKMEKEYGIRVEKEFADVESQLQDLVNQVGTANAPQQTAQTAQG